MAGSQASQGDIHFSTENEQQGGKQQQPGNGFTKQVFRGLQQKPGTKHAAQKADQYEPGQFVSALAKFSAKCPGTAYIAGAGGKGVGGVGA